MTGFRYRQTVRARLQRAIRYPPKVQRGQGTVRLFLTIARNGTVQSAACQEASAPAFEEAAMDGVAAAGPFPSVPAEVSQAPLTYEFLVAFVPGADASVGP